MTTRQVAQQPDASRRATQGQGPLFGMLLPAYLSFNPHRHNGRKPCHFCPKATLRPPDALGRIVCASCRPPKQPPKPGEVARLCVRCDGTVHVGETAKGPFLCDRCRRFLTTGRHTKYEADTPTLRSADYTPERERRVAELVERYAAVFAAGSEMAARRAGLPTTLEEFARSFRHDHPVAADEPQEDDGD